MNYTMAEIDKINCDLMNRTVELARRALQRGEELYRKLIVDLRETAGGKSRLPNYATMYMYYACTHIGASSSSATVCENGFLFGKSSAWA